jgi:hypothetical protein
MVRMRMPGGAIAVVACLAGCGRIGFDAGIDVSPAAIDVSPVAIDVSLAAIGCSDGTREGFVDLATYPTIAGCAASWTGTLSLRASATGAACGDSSAGPGAPCAAPADACATGWHACSDNGDPSDLSSRLSAAQCSTDAVGTFVAATSHCTGYPPCVYTTPYGCYATGVSGAEAVCCGTTCDTDNACQDGVFAGATKIRGGNAVPGCAAVPPGLVTGVLCCK